ncbi:PH domain-containing protein [bacterium]|nr:PH domain-containing protein [bacterium]
MEKILLPHKKYITKSIIVSCVSSLFSYGAIAGLGCLIANSNDAEPDVLSLIRQVSALAFLITVLISIPIIFLYVKNLKYIIQEDRVTVYRGILTKIQKNIPLRAVTDFILERSLLDRFLGIGAVKIQTAGQSPSASGFEGKLAGLLEYEATHDDLRQRIGKFHNEAGIPEAGGRNRESEETVLEQILNELKEIRKNTARK